MTVVNASVFAPPSPGAWELEQTHLTRPISYFMAEVFPSEMMRGFKDGSRAYGALLDHLEIGIVNRFAYMAPRPVGAPKGAKGPPPRAVFEIMRRVHPEMRRRIRRADEVFRTRAWREDVRRWNEEVKPAILAEARTLLAEHIPQLSNADLAAYLRRVTAFARQTIYWHHRYSIPVILPVGDLLVHTIAWTGMSPGEILQGLSGLSPASAGAVDELRALARALHADPTALGLLLSDRSAAEILHALEAMPGAVGEAARAYLDVVGLRIVGGYDIADSHAREVPDLLVKIMRAAATTDETSQRARSEQALARIRERVPAGHRDEFDALVEEARLTYGLRDERVFYGDALGLGVARWALLEAGKRLQAGGRIDSPEHLVDATPDELIEIVEGRGGPSAAELAARFRWRVETPMSSAPPRLGLPPSAPPPPDWLPGGAARLQRIIDLALKLMFEPHSGARTAADRPASPQPAAAPATSLQGFGVSPGTFEGPARVIRSIQQLPEVQHGEVLVATSTGPTFNVVLPLIGALITERGGALSHAAIVAREYGLPGIVGCAGATSAIQTGTRVRVDGTTGEVWILP